MTPAQTSVRTECVCKACASSLSGAREFQIREMFFGSRELFSYLECPACGSLQITEIPKDLSRFYPSNYYSLGKTPIQRESLPQRIRRFFRGQLTRRQLGQPSLLGNLIGRVYAARNPLPVWLKADHLRLSLHSRILDVGCGGGALLASLRRFGFNRLEGIEPFITDDVDWGPIKIHRTKLEEFQGGNYELLMLHHVLEHLPDPISALQHLASMLAVNGCLIIRIPVAGCRAWQLYGTDWVQMDAPRHIVIFTPSALTQQAKRCGLNLAGMYYDSNAFQFWGSEQYRRGIPLEDPRSVFHQPPLGPFTRSEMDEFERESAVVNQKQLGDQAVFYFKKGSHG